jgi:hypothetical protein
MVNEPVSVKTSVKYLGLETISANGYDFTWNVAVNGYEWLGGDTVESRFASRIVRNAAESYNKDTILRGGYESLLTENVYPYHLESQPPWLVPKGELELDQRQRAEKTKGKDWKSVPVRQYNPLSFRTLHRQFASLNTQSLETEVLKFTNKYGLLGRMVALRADPKKSPGGVEGESLKRWQIEIERIGVLLAIWDLIRVRDAGKLGQFFIWHYNPDYVEVRLKWRYQKGAYEISRWDGKEKAEGFGHHHTTVAIRSISPIFFSEYKGGTSVGPAWWWLGSNLNGHLQGVHPRFNSCHQTEVTHTPETLLDALWLLFMLEVQGKVKVTRCNHCGEWFEWERNTKAYCTPNCRSLAFYHREKLKEAQNERKHKAKKQK